MNRALFKDTAAEADLIGIWLFTYENWGEQQADDYLDAIVSGVADLARSPEKGRPRESLRSGYWSRGILRHLAFYTFNRMEVRLRRVLHRAMDPGFHLADR